MSSNNNVVSNSNSKKFKSDSDIIDDRYLTEEQKRSKLQSGQRMLKYSRSGILDGVIKSIKDGNVHVDYKSNGYTALGYAAFNRQNQIIKWLITIGGCEVDLPCAPTNISPLGIAVQQGNSDSVAVLLALGASPESLDKDRKSLFFYAVTTPNCNIRTIELLNKTGKINMEEKDEDENLLIHHAALCSDWRVVDFLVSEMDFSILATNKHGKTILHRAVIFKNKPLVKWLVENHKPLIDVQDNIGYTALHYAAIYNLFEISKILVENQSDTDILDFKQQLTPYQLSNEKSFADITFLLLKYSKDEQVDRYDFYIKGKVNLSLHDDIDEEHKVQDDQYRKHQDKLKLLKQHEDKDEEMEDEEIEVEVDEEVEGDDGIKTTVKTKKKIITNKKSRNSEESLPLPSNKKKTKGKKKKTKKKTEVENIAKTQENSDQDDSDKDIITEFRLSTKNTKKSNTKKKQKNTSSNKTTTTTTPKTPKTKKKKSTIDTLPKPTSSSGISNSSSTLFSFKIPTRSSNSQKINRIISLFDSSSESDYESEKEEKQVEEIEEVNNEPNFSSSDEKPKKKLKPSSDKYINSPFQLKTSRNIKKILLEDENDD